MELSAEEERLANADGLHTAASAAHDALLGDPSSGSYDLPDAVSLLATATQALEAVAGHDPVLAGLAARLSEAAYLISDIGAELASYVESVEADPARLAAVQQRRADLTRLIRSYGGRRRGGRRGRGRGRRAGLGQAGGQPGWASWTVTTTGSPAWPRKRSSSARPSPGWRPSSPRCARRPPRASPPR